MAAFDLDAYRRAHPDSTPADAQAAHREFVADDLHDQFLLLLTQHLDEFQLATMQGFALKVGIQLVAPEDAEHPEALPVSPVTPTLTVVH